MVSLSTYRLTCLFFGLTPETVSQARMNLFSEIHEIVFHGQGGYDYNTIYNMPLWLRKFTFNKIQEYYTKQNEQMKAASKKGGSTTLMDSSGNTNKAEAAKVSPGKVQYK